MSQHDSGAVIIRAATAGDAGAIHAMILTMAADMGMAERIHSQPSDIQGYGFSDPPCFYGLIAEQAGHPVGLCLYFFSFSTWMGRRGVYVQDLYVDGTQRGTGLGRRLIAETARRAGEQGATYMRLSVDQGNTAAQEFYSRIGMERSPHECIFRAVGERFEALKHIV
jgi:ribosomal protein S18 acetylase RimI-like enzyme